MEDLNYVKFIDQNKDETPALGSAPAPTTDENKKVEDLTTVSSTEEKKEDKPTPVPSSPAGTDENKTVEETTTTTTTTSSEEKKDETPALGSGAPSTDENKPGGRLKLC